jgi:hypothetical protein
MQRSSSTAPAVAWLRRIALPAAFLGGLVAITWIPRGVATAAPTVPGDAGDAITLEDKVRSEWAAFVSRDASAYRSLLADDYVGVEVDGEGTRTREQAAAELGQARARSAEVSRVAVRMLAADAAMVTCEVFLQFTPANAVRALRVYVTEIWSRRTGDWQLIHSQETRVR